MTNSKIVKIEKMLEKMNCGLNQDFASGKFTATTTKNCFQFDMKRTSELINNNATLKVIKAAVEEDLEEVKNAKTIEF